jgi:hypothetical protein
MPAPNAATMDVALQSICLSLVPFLLAACDADPARAREVAADMIRAYEPADMIELDLIGRIVGFGLAAMDNIRRSIADPELPAAMVLRYRSAAASLSRSAEKCRAVLNAGRTAPAEAESKASKSHPRPRAAKPADDAVAEKSDDGASVTLGRIAHLRTEWGMPLQLGSADAPQAGPACTNDAGPGAAQHGHAHPTDTPSRLPAFVQSAEPGAETPTPRPLPQRVLLPFSR